MHKEVLNQNQIELLPLLKQFFNEYYLAGGTAIALHIGHRMSLDFDLFKNGSLKHRDILSKIKESNYEYIVTRNVSEQFNFIINEINLTFLIYPFPIVPNNKFDDALQIPDLLSLSAMKAYALGRRSKWKDYIDLFFILQNHFSISEVSAKAREIFGEMFSEKLFRSQLSYFEDIDFSEKVIYIHKEPEIEEIKDFLEEKAIDF